MNAREVGRMHAQLGWTVDDLAHAFGIDPQWVHVVRMSGAAAVAEAAYEYTHPSLQWVHPEDQEAATQEQRGEFEACLALVRFARAVNEYARTPHGTHAPTQPAHRLVHKYEDVGGPESGPSLAIWLEVEEVRDVLIHT